MRFVPMLAAGRFAGSPVQPRARFDGDAGRARPRFPSTPFAPRLAARVDTDPVRRGSGLGGFPGPARRRYAFPGRSLQGSSCGASSQGGYLADGFLDVLRRRRTLLRSSATRSGAGGADPPRRVWRRAGSPPLRSPASRRALPPGLDCLPERRAGFAAEPLRARCRRWAGTTGMTAMTSND